MSEDIKFLDRLKEIAALTLGELSDEEVLRLLAERTRLKELEVEYLKQQEALVHVKELEGKKRELEKKLGELNKLISPDKPDDELLSLIKERKEIEAKLDTVSAELGIPQEEVVPKVEIISPAPETESREPEVVTVKASENAVVKEGVKIAVSEGNEESKDDEFGDQKIGGYELPESSNLWMYIEQMKLNPSQMGTILNQLPDTAKQDKSFMLEVGKIDPAYAMHYADAKTLKKDEDFNLRLITMKNDRHSGSVLAEMSPEGRTSRVILAAVKQDYKNMRFALPQMADYDAILKIGKEGTLDAVKQLKEGVDVSVLVPKILQKDVSFMQEVQKIVEEGKK